MPHGVIGIGLLAVMSFAIFNGLFMLVAPLKHRRFLMWFGDIDSGSGLAVERSTRRGLDLGRRLAGIGLASIGVYVASNVIRDAGLNEPEAPLTPGSVGGHLVSLLIGCCSLGCGVFIVLKPNWIVQWSKKHQPIAVDVSDHMLMVWRRGAIFLGALLLLGGLYTLWTVLRTS